MSVEMPYKHKRDCPVCDKLGLRYMSNHLRQVHHLYGDERKKCLGPWPDTYSRRNVMCSQENLFCTTANKSRVESNSIYGKQTLSGIQLSP